MKSVSRKQSGFAMLEVLLAVIVIAIVSFGVYELYHSATNNSNLSAEERAVSELAAAAQQYTQTNYQALTDATLLSSSGLVAKNLINPNDPSSFVGPFGQIDVIGDSTNFQSIQVTANGVPNDVAVQLCKDMFPAVSSLTANDTKINPQADGVDLSACNDVATGTSGTFIFNFSGNTSS
jgi:prepilin-type N-terminal cleavage/methylation domain-containing protein